MIGLTVICDWNGVVDENMCNVVESGFCRRGKFCFSRQGFVTWAFFGP